MLTGLCLRFLMLARARTAVSWPAPQRRMRRAILGAVAFIVINGLATDQAAAIDIRCIEASKYKYLVQLFENDWDRLAAFAGVPVSQRPDPEACRAILITGRIEPTAGKRTGETLFREGWSRLRFAGILPA